MNASVHNLRLGSFSLLAGVLTPLALICSCTLGPDYASPQTQTPEGWKLVTASSESIPADWWRLFNEPALNTLMERALADNQDLRASLARVDQARAIARVSEADFYPTITLDPALHRDRFSANRAVAPGGRGGPYTTTTVSVPFDLSYEIDVWGRVKRSFEAAGAAAEASELDRQSAYLTVTGDVARGYFALRALDQEHAVLTEAVALREKAVEILQGRFNSGIGNEVDLSRAKTELATAQADLRNVLRRRSAQENALAVLCGQAAPSFAVERSTEPVRAIPVPVALPSELMARRPDIAAAAARVHEASARIGVAQAAFYPRFMLTGAAGTVSADLQSVFDPASRAWSIGPSVSLPIFEAGRNDARLQQAEAFLRERDASYRQTLLVAFREVQDALSALDELAREIEFETQAQQSADRTFELANGRFSQGLVSYLDVVDAARSQLETRRSIVRLRAVQVESTVLLIKALGGGWKEAPLAPTHSPVLSVQPAAR